jgi:hypothetical protein
MEIILYLVLSLLVEVDLARLLEQMVVQVVVLTLTHQEELETLADFLQLKVLMAVEVNLLLIHFATTVAVAAVAALQVKTEPRQQVVAQ